MQIIIDIPEVYYEALSKTEEIIPSQRSGKTLMSVIYSAVGNGTPLPKGHGKIIDVNEAINYIDDYAFGFFSFDDVPTIIEADTESEDT